MTRKMIYNVKRSLLIGSFAIAVASCGTYQGYGYDDGIYGEQAPLSSTTRERAFPQGGNYKRQLQERAKEYGQFADKAKAQQPQKVTPITDVDAYTSYQSDSGYYPSWGSGQTSSSVNVYNNYYPYNSWGYSPYWGGVNYWGSRAWYPYGGYEYYRPWRSGWSVSIGNYSPYWGFNYGYYSYSPYYYSPYAYAYPYPYYGYNGYYYARREDSPNYTRSRRGDSRRYQSNSYNTNARRSSSSANYGTSREVGRYYSPNSSYSGWNNNSNNSSSYDSGRYNRNSGGSYNSGSSSGSSRNSGSGGGTTRRDY